MNTPRSSRLVRHQLVPPATVRERAGLISFMSAQTRRGQWEVPQQMRVACVLGSAELDLREAILSSGVSEIHVVCVLGSVEIFVPPGIRVEMMVDSFVGSAEFMPDPTLPSYSDVPVLRIRGDAHLASVEVFVRYAGETARDAKKRIKANW